LEDFYRLAVLPPDVLGFRLTRVGRIMRGKWISRIIGLATLATAFERICISG
jgi:hypothetical protein